MPQRRRRVFILAYHESSSIFKQIKPSKTKLDWLVKNGIIAAEFPVQETQQKPFTDSIHTDLKKVSDEFNKEGKLSPFQNTGLMIDGRFWTLKTTSSFAGDRTVLEEILEPSSEVPEEFFISTEELQQKNGWEYQKGAKKINRTNAAGHSYVFSEGGLIFPDPLDGPSRTIITGEGGKSPSRFKHVIFKDGEYRRLTPKELERLNMFPDDHTKLDGISDQKRAFFMGNALVVGIVEKLGRELAKRIT
jgi:DNA (cytosine-5)-methyltransferase 1